MHLELVNLFEVQDMPVVAAADAKPRASAALRREAALAARARTAPSGRGADQPAIRRRTPIGARTLER